MSRVAEWRFFLRDLRKSDVITLKAEYEAIAALKLIAASLNKNINMPTTFMEDVGTLMLYWDHEEHHLELEIIGNGSVGMFYRNRNTGSTEHRNLSLGGSWDEYEVFKWTIREIV